MQTGGGGFGVYNACAGPTDRTRSFSDACENSSDVVDIPVFPMFPGGQNVWEKRCGGVQSIGGCANLPQKPETLGSLPIYQSVREPSLVELCQRSWFLNVRGTSPRTRRGNPNVTEGQRISCPQELVDVTGLQRADDFSFSPEGVTPGGDLTSTMDCCAPSASFPTNVPGSAARPRVIPCRRDGYTRVASI